MLPEEIVPMHSLHSLFALHRQSKLKDQTQAMQACHNSKDSRQLDPLSASHLCATIWSAHMHVLNCHAQLQASTAHGNDMLSL